MSSRSTRGAPSLARHRRRALEHEAGGKLGRVDDLIVRLGEDEYPPVTGLLATVAGRQVFVPADSVSAIEQGRTTLARPSGSTCARSSAGRRRCC